MRFRRNVATLASTAVFFVFGLALWIQPHRWERTPSYANLLELLPQWAWGTIHLFVGACMLASTIWLTSRVLAVFAHTLALALIGSWWLAFVVRWWTDDATTIVNVVSWGVFLTLLIWSAAMLDDDRTRAEAVTALNVKERREPR